MCLFIQCMFACDELSFVFSVVKLTIVFDDHVSKYEADSCNHSIGNGCKDHDGMMIPGHDGEDDSKKENDCINGDKECILLQNSINSDRYDCQAEQHG